MPRPWFSNSLTAYSSMSPYGSTVGTVATTTTSPVAACSARIMRSISRGARGVDDVREIVDRLRSAPAARIGGVRARSRRHARERPRCSAAADDGDASAATATPSGSVARAPAVDVRDEPLDRVEVRREQTLGVGRRNLVDAGERDDVGDGAVRRRRARAPRGARPHRLVGGVRRRAARRFVSERRKRPRPTRTMSIGERVGAAAVSRYPSRRWSRWLRACTSHARRRSAGSTARPSNGFAPDDDHVVGEDRAELERERVERSPELVRGERAAASPGPRVPRGDAPAQARRSSRVSVRPSPACASVSACRARRLRVDGRAAAVHDERPQAVAEDLAQLAVERAEPRRDRHASIVRGYGCLDIAGTSAR